LNNAFAGVDRVVLDRTGIAGDFDFTLEFTLPRPTLDGGAAANSDDAGPALGTARREQLGLALRSTRAPLDVPVIDRIERPTEDDPAAARSSDPSRSFLDNLALCGSATLCESAPPIALTPCSRVARLL
jgi:hypothetical protein